MKRICQMIYLLALLAMSLAACGGDSSSPPGGGSSPPPLTGVDPVPNETAAPVNTNVTGVFSQTMNAADSNTFVVNGSQTGKRGGAYTGGGTTTLSFDPNNDLKPGEEVEVTLTTDLTTTGGSSLERPFTYRFLAAVTDTGSNANFVATVTVPVGARPISITTGDWDQDGALDVAVGNRSTFDVTLLLNDGRGNFFEPLSSPIRVRSQPSAIVAGDWDGDGDMDLAVANRFTFDITVLLNDGNGDFFEPLSSPVGVGRQPTAITAGDWDGDGDQDLAVTNELSFDVTVLLNDGTGRFREAFGSPVGVGNQPSAIVAGDWEGDGDLDLAVANRFTFDVTVLLNNGVARFREALSSPVGAGIQPSAIVAGDWEGDGDLDLAVTNQFTFDVTVLSNDGIGRFREPLSSPVGVGDQPSAIVAADWDGDGDLDLAVVNSFTSDVTVLLNNGVGGFNEPLLSPVGVGNRPSSLVAGDWDRDGDVDLVVANEFTDDVTVLSNGL